MSGHVVVEVACLTQVALRPVMALAGDVTVEACMSGAAAPVAV